MTFRSRPFQDDDAVVALVVRRSFTELLVLNTQVMMGLHDSRNATLSLDWMLGIQQRWATWCGTWVLDGRTTGNVYTDPFLGVLWDWGRITISICSRTDKRVSMSSLSVLARSAVQVIVRYSSIYRRLPYNLMHQHLQQIRTCANIIVLCFWKFEMTKTEAEVSIAMAVWMIGLMVPRWGKQAADASRKITQLSEAVGLDISPASVDGSLQNFSAGALASMSSTESFIDAHGALGSLYETFQNFNQNTASLPSWTIDPLFLAAEYQ